MKQFISILVLIFMLPSLVLGAQLATETTRVSTEKNTELSAASLEPREAVLLAHVTDADKAAMPITEEPKAQRGHNWDTFWDVHFGGYRWAWWALAAGVIVAIHVAAAD